MRSSKLINAVAGLAIVGSAAWLWVAVNGWPPSPEARPAEASGWGMAKEALRALKPGGRLVVIVRDTEAFKHPETDLQLRSFEQAVHQAGVTIGATRTLQVDPLRALEVPGGDFYELIRRAPTGSVIVSFMGPPILTADQRARLSDPKPPIIAFCPGALPQQIDLRVLFAEGLLRAAVISRGTPARPATPPKDSNGWFDRYYRIITAADVANLYEPTSGSP